MQFFRVRNFEKFQHYADRRPPWIKLYRDLWDDPRFFRLSDSDRYLLIGLFVLASQHENKVSSDQKWLKAQLLTSKTIPLQFLIDTGWLEDVEQAASPPLSASAASAERYPSRAGGETETEVQRQNTETENPLTPLLTFGEFRHVRLTADQHASLITRLNGHTDDYINRLDRWGEDQPAKFAKRKSHYATILTWFDRDVKDGKVKDGKRENPNTRAAQNFVSRKLAETLRPDLPDVRKDSGSGLP